MATEKTEGTPQSPEVQERYVREELDQDEVSHTGDWRKPFAAGHATKGGGHLGALEDEVVPVVPPMAGPADVVGEYHIDAQGNETGDTEVGEEAIDPRDHLTPG